jgi:hypothetical protein
VVCDSCKDVLDRVSLGETGVLRAIFVVEIYAKIRVEVWIGLTDGWPVELFLRWWDFNLATKRHATMNFSGCQQICARKQVPRHLHVEEGRVAPSPRSF